MTPEKPDTPDKQPDPQEDTPEPRPATDPRRVYRDDGHGCVERVHPSELAWEERYG